MNNARMTHADAELLLPWYANRTLQPREHDAVGEHLDECDACRDALALLNVMKAAVADTSTVPLVPDPHPESLFEQLDRRVSIFAGRFAARHVAIAAGFVLAATSIAFILNSVSPEPVQPAYRTVTSANTGDEVAYVVELEFADSVTEQRHQAVLDELGATLISSNGSGRITALIPVSTTSMSELEDWRSAWLQRSEIAELQIVAVQLPVRENE